MSVCFTVKTCVTSADAVLSRSTTYVADSSTHSRRCKTSLQKSGWSWYGAFANFDKNFTGKSLVCKYLKSNAIALVKNKQLIGKGCGQTSRIDSLRQAIEKANQFNFDLHGAVLASDAFFPFNDCVKMGHQAGISAFIQPGGSVRDKDSIDYCVENKLAMVMTGMRHFKH